MKINVREKADQYSAQVNFFIVAATFFGAIMFDICLNLKPSESWENYVIVCCAFGSTFCFFFGLFFSGLAALNLDRAKIKSNEISTQADPSSSLLKDAELYFVLASCQKEYGKRFCSVGAGCVVALLFFVFLQYQSLGITIIFIALAIWFIWCCVILAGTRIVRENQEECKKQALVKIDQALKDSSDVLFEEAMNMLRDGNIPYFDSNYMPPRDWFRTVIGDKDERDVKEYKRKQCFDIWLEFKKLQLERFVVIDSADFHKQFENVLKENADLDFK